MSEPPGATVTLAEAPTSDVPSKTFTAQRVRVPAGAALDHPELPERLHPPGWTEISAECTDPEYRGRGLATRLVHAVAAGIKERGERPFLHARADNANAIRLYESIGFTLRRRTVFSLVRRTEAAALEETA